MEVDDDNTVNDMDELEIEEINEEKKKKSMKKKKKESMKKNLRATMICLNVFRRKKFDSR